jgi:hypothetical protein
MYARYTRTQINTIRPPMIWNIWRTHRTWTHKHTYTHEFREKRAFTKIRFVRMQSEHGTRAQVHTHTYARIRAHSCKLREDLQFQVLWTYNEAHTYIHTYIHAREFWVGGNRAHDIKFRTHVVRQWRQTAVLCFGWRLFCFWSKPLHNCVHMYACVCMRVSSFV